MSISVCVCVCVCYRCNLLASYSRFFIFQVYLENSCSGTDAVLVYLWNGHHQPIFGRKVQSELSHVSELSQLLHVVPHLYNDAGFSVRYVACAHYLSMKLSAKMLDIQMFKNKIQGKTKTSYIYVSYLEKYDTSKFCERCEQRFMQSSLKC